MCDHGKTDVEWNPEEPCLKENGTKQKQQQQKQQ